MVGCVFNVGEITCFLRWKQHDKPAALGLGILLALVSISASVGALQVSLERGAMESTDYTQKLKEIDLIDGQISELQDTAKKQKSINHITRSRETSDEATALLIDRRKAQNELTQLRTQGAGLNAALYRAYAKFLGLDVMDVAIWINIAMSLLIELGFLYFTTASVNKTDIVVLDNDDGNGQLDNLVDSLNRDVFLEL